MDILAFLTMNLKINTNNLLTINKNNKKTLTNRNYFKNNLINISYYKMMIITILLNMILKNNFITQKIQKTY